MEIKLRHYASKTVNVSYGSDVEGLITETFVGCLSISFAVFGYIHGLEFLTIAMAFPAIICIMSVSITIHSLISQAIQKRSGSNDES